MVTNSASRAFLSVTEAGARIGVKRARAYVLAAEGAFPTVVIGGKIRVPAVAFEAWIESANIAAIAGTADATRACA